MYTVKLLQRAKIELSEAFIWYEEQQQGLAKRLLKEVDNYLVLLRKNPLQFNVRFSENYRIAPLQVFPYTLAYRVDEINNIVYVISIFHTSRSPHEF